MATTLAPGRELAPTGDAQVDDGRDVALSVDLASAALRLVIGAILAGHGLQKLGLFEGGGLPAGVGEQAEFLGFFGYESTSFLSWLLTVAEIGAGVLLLVGLAVPLAAAAAIGIMFQFVAGIQWRGGLFGNEQALGFEMSLAFLAGAAALALLGGGRFSLDRRLGLGIHGARWGLAGIALGLLVGVLVLEIFGPGLGGRELSL